jgi:hypothetical protein
MSLQNPNILLDVLEIAVDHLRELIERTRMTVSNRPHKRKPLARQKVSGGLDAGEADFIARLFWNSTALSYGLKGFRKIVRSFV